MTITLDSLKALKVNESIKDGALTVKRKERGSFVLFLDGENGHARWGNRTEIMSDVEHARMHGVLPREKTRWL